MVRSKRSPAIPMSHPAQYLREDALPALGVGKSEFARALGVSRQTVYDLLDEKQGITAAMAVRLEAVVGSTAEFWLRRQAAYDLWKARQEVDCSTLTRLLPRLPAEAAE